MPVPRCVRHWRTGSFEVSRDQRKLTLNKFRIPFDLLGQNRAASAATAHGVDVAAITNTINSALASAGLTSQSGVARNVTDTIQRAFASAGLTTARSAQPAGPVVIDGVARDITARDSSVDADTSNVIPLFSPAAGGQFVTRSFSCAAGTRAYKLYVPASYATVSEERVPLVVMLHGCTQDPDDFAAGTRMNALAERDGFLVAYPAQPAQASASTTKVRFRSAIFL